MATPLPEMITEIGKVFGSISTYADSLGAYLFNPTSNPAPEFDASQLTVDTLLDTIRNNKDSAVDLSAGAMSATVYKAAGIARELSTRSLTKSMMYDLAIEQAASIKEETNGTGGKTVSELRSQTPAQELGL